MNGEQALSITLRENGVALAAGVYGDPCTSLLRSLSEAGLHVEISVEEKTAMAQALGASVAGRRAVAVFKQVGVNVAADALAGAATHGCGAGLLVLMGDDPGAAKSTTEQDSRWYARLSELPVLTPHGADHLCRSAAEGLELSEALGLPVLLQLTARLTRAEDPAGAHRAGGSGAFDRARPWGRFMLDRHKLLLEQIYPELLGRVERSELHAVRSGGGPVGVLTCGGASQLAQGIAGPPLFALGYAHPLPERRLAEFLTSLERVVVVEEVAPIVEEATAALAARAGLGVRVLGRLSGHLPRVGALEARHLETALAAARAGDAPAGWTFDVQQPPTDAIMTLPCGGFEPLYRALDAALPEGHWVAGDVGCSILQGYFPPRVVDTAYALGTSIATASGLSLDGRKGVALIGDTGFVHSGITALLNAVAHGHELLVIVLHNAIPGMTPGHLPIPGLDRLRELAAACGVAGVAECDADADGEDALQALLEAELARPGVRVVFARATPRPLGGGA